MKIRCGTKRIVFIFNKIVIKLPKINRYESFIRGILENIVEGKLSGLHEDLCKVIYCNRFGLFSIMEKANPIPDDIDRFDFLEMLENKYKNDLCKDILLSDFTPENYGYINDRIVKVDYGK